jgi:hypothetical protein
MNGPAPPTPDQTTATRHRTAQKTCPTPGSKRHQQTNTTCPKRSGPAPFTEDTDTGRRSRSIPNRPPQTNGSLLQYNPTPQPCQQPKLPTHRQPKPSGDRPTPRNPCNTDSSAGRSDSQPQKLRNPAQRHNGPPHRIPATAEPFQDPRRPAGLTERQMPDHRPRRPTRRRRRPSAADADLRLGTRAAPSALSPSVSSVIRTPMAGRPRTDANPHARSTSRRPYQLGGVLRSTLTQPNGSFAA